MWHDDYPRCSGVAPRPRGQATTTSATDGGAPSAPPGLPWMRTSSPDDTYRPLIVNRNVLPCPTTLSTQMLPLYVSTMLFTLASPTPLPATFWAWGFFP